MSGIGSSDDTANYDSILLPDYYHLMLGLLPNSVRSIMGTVRPQTIRELQ
jgi:hypothetical protein